MFVSDLSLATKKCNLQNLKKAIHNVENSSSGLKSEIKDMLTKAYDMAKRLQHVEHLKQCVMKLNNRAIAEIRESSNSPDLVHKVMGGVALMLGNKEKDIQVTVHILFVCVWLLWGRGWSKCRGWFKGMCWHEGMGWHEGNGLHEGNSWHKGIGWHAGNSWHEENDWHAGNSWHEGNSWH